MAEGLFRKAIVGKPAIRTSSAGVAATDGTPASRETTAILAKHNAALDSFASRRVTEEILENATLVFAMTEGHLAMLEARFPEYSDKYHLIGEYAAQLTERYDHDVPDPIGCGMKAYDEVATIIQTAIPGILAQIEASE